MQTLLHADIFFFVTTIAVVLLTIVLIVILIYIAIILGDIREISRMVRKESAEIAEDMKDIHAEIRANLRGGVGIASVFKIFRWLSSRRKKARRGPVKDEDVDEN